MFKKTVLASFFAFSSMLVALSPAAAQVVEGVDAKTAQILKTNFEKKTKVPAGQINYIGQSAFPGVYIVLANGFSLPVYSDINFDKMFVGNYVDNSRQIDIVNELKKEHYRIPVAKLNLKNAVVDKYGDGSQKLYVFSDANCGYCKKLEAEVLSNLKNATVYTFPISILRPGGEKDQQVRTVLCQPEKEQGRLFADVMLSNKGSIGNQSCEKAKALDKNTALAKEVGVSGTPTLVFANSTVHGGFLDLVSLEAQLQKIK